MGMRMLAGKLIRKGNLIMPRQIMPATLEDAGQRVLEIKEWELTIANITSVSFDIRSRSRTNAEGPSMCCGVMSKAPCRSKKGNRQRSRKTSKEAIVWVQDMIIAYKTNGLRFSMQSF